MIVSTTKGYSSDLSKVLRSYSSFAHAVIDRAGELSGFYRTPEKEAIRLGAGVPYYILGTQWARSMREAEEIISHGSYTDPHGTEKLRQAVVKRFQKDFNVALDPVKEIVTGLGSSQLLFQTMSCFANGRLKSSHSKQFLQNRRAVLFFPYPSYMLAREAFESHSVNGTKTVDLPLDHKFLLDLDDLETAFKDSKNEASSRLLYINYPHNPSGQVLEADYLRKLVELCEQNNVILFNDNAYGGLEHSGENVSLVGTVGTSPMVLESFTFSKAFGAPNLRVGYLVGNNKLIEVIQKQMELTNGGLNPLTEAAAALMLVSDEVAKIQKLSLQLYQEQLLTLNSLVGRLPFAKPENIFYPPAGFFLTVPVNASEELTADKISFRWYGEHGLLTVSERYFSPTGLSITKPFIRLSAANPNSIDLLSQCVARL